MNISYAVFAVKKIGAPAAAEGGGERVGDRLLIKTSISLIKKNKTRRASTQYTNIVVFNQTMYADSSRGAHAPTVSKKVRSTSSYHPTYPFLFTARLPPTGMHT